MKRPFLEMISRMALERPIPYWFFEPLGRPTPLTFAGFFDAAFLGAAVVFADATTDLDVAVGLATAGFAIVLLPDDVFVAMFLKEFLLCYYCLLIVNYIDLNVGSIKKLHCIKKII